MFAAMTQISQHGARFVKVQDADTATGEPAETAQALSDAADQRPPPAATDLSIVVAEQPHQQSRPAGGFCGRCGRVAHRLPLVPV